MANKLYDEDAVRDIAEAIREKNGTENTYTVSEMAPAIRDLTGGGIEVTSLAIKTPPTKTVYLAGEPFDPAGMTVEVTYDNGAKLTTGGFTVSPETLTDGVTKVTVTYTEGGKSVTAQQAVTVIHKLTEITVMPPTKTTYEYGDTLNQSGMSVKAAYSDGTEATVTPGSVSPTALNTVGEQEITVSYTENGVSKSDTFTVTVERQTLSAVPTQKGALTYNGTTNTNGTAQTPEWNGYDSAKMSLSVTAQANAGDYKASFTPGANYRWPDGSTGAKEADWSIGKKPIARVTAGTVSWSYDAAAHIPTWNNYGSGYIAIDGTAAAQTDAGDYSTTFKPLSNFKWSTGAEDDTITIDWHITRATITLPAQSGTITYDGKSHSPSWDSNYDSAKMTVDVTAQTNAGNYSASFTPTKNYQWSDGTRTAKPATWKIGQATPAISINPTSVTLNTSNLNATATVTTDSPGTLSTETSDSSIATAGISNKVVTVQHVNKTSGTAKITVKQAATTNYKAASVELAVTASFVSKILNDNSWATIKEISDADQGKNYWAEGDTKEIKLNGTVGACTFSNLTVKAFILGFNHNSNKEGTHKIHFQIGKLGDADVAFCDSSYNSTGSSAAFRMNTTNTNSGGWNASYMRKTILGNEGTPTSPVSGSLMAALPADLRAVMKPVTKYTDNTGQKSNVAENVTTTTDYLFLLAEWEVFGARTGANQYEQNQQLQYDYYKAGNSKIANNHTAVSTAVWWWLRSPSYTGTTTFRIVAGNGGSNSGTAYYSGGVRPGFAC